MRTWLDSVNEHQNPVIATILLESIIIIGACTVESIKQTLQTPSISSIVHHANKLGLSPFFSRSNWLSAILKPTNYTTFEGTVPLFELAKVKIGTVPLSWNFSDGKFHCMNNREWCQFYMKFLLQHFHWSILINLAMKNLLCILKVPNPQLCGFFWFLVMHTILAQCPTFFLLLFYFGMLSGVQ